MSSIHYLLEAKWTKIVKHIHTVVHFGEKGIFSCPLPVPISIYFLVKRDMHQIDFTMPLIFCRITDMSKVSMSSRPESGYENMDHFSLNVDHVAEMLRTIEFQTGESGWTETSCWSEGRGCIHCCSSIWVPFSLFFINLHIPCLRRYLTLRN